MTPNIRVFVNGDAREVPPGMAVDGLLAFLGLPAHRVALERNREILPRNQWASTKIEADDRLEIVHLVGGG